MNKELITQKDLQSNLSKWRSLNPNRFRNQPLTSSLVSIFKDLKELNRAAKDINFIIRKSSFYKIKSALIRWAILQVKYNMRSDISYKINSQETDGWVEYVNLDITIGDHTFNFHQKIESPLRWIIWDELVDESVPYVRDTTPSAIAYNDVEMAWLELQMQLEHESWFCFDDSDPQDWIRIIKHRYDGLFDYAKGGFKLSIALKGGPKVTFENGYVCRVGDLYTNFQHHAHRGGILHMFNSDVK